MRIIYLFIALLLCNDLNAQGPSLLWANSFSSASVDEGKALAVDADGYVYTVGNFSGSADFDPGPGTFNMTAEVNDIYITKLTSNGELVWAKSIGASGNDVPSRIVLDGAGHLVVTGQFAYKVDFDPGPDSTFLEADENADVFILRMDTAGNFSWAVSFGGEMVDNGLSLFIDGSGNIYNAGQYSNHCDFDPDPTDSLVLSAGNAQDAYVAKFDSTGNLLWARGWGAGATDVARDVTVADNGDVYIVGNFTGQVDFDPGAQVAYQHSGNNGTNAFLLKLSAAGYYVWAKDLTAVSSGSSESCIAIRTDSFGNFYLCGTFNGTADFDPGQGEYFLSASDDGQSDIFVTKLDPAAELVWVRSMGGRRSDRPLAMELNKDGSIFLTGSFNDTADLDPGPGNFNLVSINSNDAFACKLSPHGNFNWAVAFNGSNMQNGNGIAVDGNGGVYVTGNFRGACDLDPGPGVQTFTPQGNYYDAFTLKLSDPPDLKVLPAIKMTDVSLFPNPAREEVSLTSGRGFGNANIRLFHISGQLLREWHDVKGKDLSINLNGLAQGIYFVEVQDQQNGKQCLKLVKE